ncbi:MAG: 1,4-alpha-glucan branching enzyme, partial [Gammaproteobacteria bacterium]
MPDDATAVPAELSDHDVYLFREGTHARLHERLGCHVDRAGGGARFAVWAPNARAVSVVGDWNGWNGEADRLEPRADGSGIWEGRAPAAQPGHAYKYRIASSSGVHVPDKADPFAVRCEEPPRTASVVHGLDYAWGDQEWMASRRERNRLDAALSIYELHLGSWRRREDGGFLGYREIAHALVPYVLEAGFTHVELMPV